MTEPMSDIEIMFGPDYKTHEFFQVSGTDFVICAVTLQNGFVLAGQSGRVYRGNTPIHTLQQEAAEDAFRKCGALAAFRECDRQKPL